MSQLFGAFASKEFSYGVQKIINGSYVKMMGLDMGEFEPPQSYRSLNALFTRKLREPRPFDLDENKVISPCDSLVTEAGTLQDKMALQIKGMRYSIDQFLGDKIEQSNRDRLKDGQYINFYLSPRDYHRYHIPMDMQILKIVHIPGKLYPVNMPALRNINNLFIENERVVIEALSYGKLVYMVLVGALNVGKMEVAFEPAIKTNSDITTPQLYEYADLHVKKGDDFGTFMMGSTIIFITESNTLELHVKRSQSVRFSEVIATRI